MRDIREDLKDRIDEFRAEETRLQERLDMMVESRGYYERMLAAEEMRWGKVGIATPTTNGALVHTATYAGRERTPLSKLILEILDDGVVHSEKDVTEHAVAREFPFGKKTPLKVVHFAMVGMGKNRTIIRVAPGQYRKPNAQEVEETAQRS